MFSNTRHITALCLASCIAFSSSVIADIVISGTHVVYKSEQKSASVRLENKGSNSLLIQSWLDTGDDNAESGNTTVPFTATSPVSRIDTKRGQTIKLMYTISSALSKDRESVFWFSVLEAPPKPDATKAADQSLLRLVLCTRMKLFYRPEGLSRASSGAPLVLKQSWATSESKVALRAGSPTPYYVSFSSGDLETNDKRYSPNITVTAPFSNDIVKVDGTSGRTNPAKVHFFAINDPGESIGGNTNLQFGKGITQQGTECDY